LKDWGRNKFSPPAFSDDLAARFARGSLATIDGVKLGEVVGLLSFAGFGGAPVVSGADGRNDSGHAFSPPDHVQFLATLHDAQQGLEIACHLFHRHSLHSGRTYPCALS